MTAQLAALVGSTVDRLAFDYEVCLLLGKGPGEGSPASAELVLGCEFLLRVNGSDHIVSSGNVRTYRPALELLMSKVTNVSEPDTGVLDMHFSNGGRLLIGADERYEAWKLAIDLGMGHLVGPGDGPSDWRKYW